tara:strand:+ start:2174 stop:2572 length:399 start_codon:yes stop_codon:yes gene_type:complete
MYALVDYIGNQILIEEGKKIKIPFLDKKIGSAVSFDKVLFFDDGKNKKIGSPYVKSISFTGKIDSHGKEKKILVFKKKRRKGHQKKNGHTEKFTYVTVNKLSPTKNTKTSKSSATKKSSTPKKKKTVTAAKK